MALIAVLIIVPLLFAFAQLAAKTDNLRKLLTYSGAGLTALASAFVALSYLGTTQVHYFNFNGHIISYLLLIIDMILSVVVILYALRYARILPIILVAIQLLLVLSYEFVLKEKLHISAPLYIDALSVILILIVGFIGSALAVYSLGYMKDHVSHHPEQEDRRPFFMFLIFVFLSAMFMIACANDFMWLFTAWEVTTVASFLLIAYTKEEQAVNNAFRQIILNTLGGIALIVGIAGFACLARVGSFDALYAHKGQFISSLGFTLPLLCFVIAGIVKAAQLPFQSWLLGAMVAPTPVSALLHSSTMVKAGVFLVLKLSPLLGMLSLAGWTAMFIGGFSFLVCSVLAISQSNGKLVLAYSTIANLGLIIACAGLGTPAALWAGIFLMIFHAVSKSLLFICVGSAEHQIGSRDIEHMDGLFARLPKLALCMIIGIFGMFVAPFGMLVSKWAALESFITSKNIMLIIFLLFGSAATFFFWVKWLAKLCKVAANQKESHEDKIHKSEWLAIYLCAALTILLMIFVPLVSKYAVLPYLVWSSSKLPELLIKDSSLYVMIAMLILLAGALYVLSKRPSKARKVAIYMAGENMGDDLHFRGSMQRPVELSARNWYLEDFINEKRLSLAANLIAALGIALGLIIACAALFSVAFLLMSL